MTMNSQDDFLDALRSNPQWRDAVRAEILGEDLMQLPRQMAQFVDTTNTNFQLVHDRLTRLEDSVAGLKDDVTGLKDDVTGLKDDVTGLKDDVAGLKTSVASLEAGQERITGRLDSLEAGQERTIGRLDSLETGQERIISRLGNLTGSDYEREVSQSAQWIMFRHMGMRRSTVLRSKSVQERDEIPELITEAVLRGSIDHNEAYTLMRADLITGGPDRDGDDAYVVCEIAVTGYDDDVTRARDRAAMLRRAVPGAGVTAAVIAQSAPEQTAALANRENVRLMLFPEPAPDREAPGD
jgi:uncharacterized protein YoxC